MLISFLFGVSAASSIPHKLASKAEGEEVRFFLQLTSPAALMDQVEAAAYATSDEKARDLVSKLQQFAAETAAPLEESISRLISSGSIKSVNRYYISNTLAIVGDKQALLALAGHPSVAEMADNTVDFEMNPSAYSSIRTVNWKHVNEKLDYVYADRAKHVNINVSLRYAHADSGVDYLHPSLVGNYLGNLGNGSFDHNYAWFDAIKEGSDEACPLDGPEPCDDNDHGTATLSIAVGSETVGMNPSAKWMTCRNMLLFKGTTEAYLGCLQFLLAPTDLQGKNPRPELRPHVVGNSYGCEEFENCYRRPFKDAVRAIYLADILFVAAVGNSGTGGCNTISEAPASSRYSFNVASGDVTGRASYSSLGPVKGRTNAIDLIAPGDGVIAAKADGGFGEFGGTSSSCAVVAGAALILMEACPHLIRNPSATRHILTQSAIPVYSSLMCGNDSPTTIPNNEFGYGQINLKQAIKLCSNSDK